jgi:hypothetical protein
VLLRGYQDHALSMTRRMGWLEADLPPRDLMALESFK